MNNNLNVFYKIVSGANSPEEVFGYKENGVMTQYRYYARTVHPDYNKNDEKLANECFILLTSWKKKADEKIKLGLYGKETIKNWAKNNVKSKIIIGKYEINQKLFNGNLSQIFSAEDSEGNKVLLKIVNSHKDNDLLENEWNNLSLITKTKLKSCTHVSRIINSFETKNSKGVIKRVNVFKLSQNKYYSFEDVAKKYPLGIPATAAAWIFNRLLAGLFVAHKEGIVHGSMVPCNLLINAEFHNGRIIDWCYSTKNGNKIKAIVPQYKSFYPKEVFDKTSSYATDIYMAAKCIKWLLNGSTGNKTIPIKINQFLDYCILQRPSDVLHVYDEFKEVLISTFGPPKFIKFEM